MASSSSNSSSKNLETAWNAITTELNTLHAKAKLRIAIETEAAHTFTEADITLAGCLAYYYKEQCLSSHSEKTEIDIQGSAKVHVENRIATVSGDDLSITTNAGKTLVSKGTVL